MSLFPPPPSTSNTLSSQRRSAFVRSSKKLSNVLGDVPRVLDDDISPYPSRSALELTRTRTLSSSPVPRDTESTWHKRKPTHLQPLLKHSSASIDAPDSPESLTSPVYHPDDSILSVAPTASSTASGSGSGSTSPTQRRTKLERVRRKLGHEVPATAVFPTPYTPLPTLHTPGTSNPPAHARARLPSHADDAHPVAFAISSDESVHHVTLTAARVHSPRPHKSKHVYQTGPLPPVPSIPVHLMSASTTTSSRPTAYDDNEDDAGLVRHRQKMAAGSRIGGTDFKAARRAKRERRAQNGMAEPGELVEMVGFMF